MFNYRILVLLIGALPLTACVKGVEIDRSNCRIVGGLLPFSGGLASTGTNIERALTLGVETINEQGGVGDEDLCLLSADTHSETDRGMSSARKLLQEVEVEALFGPEDDDLALLTVSLVRTAGVIGMSGGATAPSLRVADDGGLWFRTVPSAVTMGQALAERMVADGIERASVLYEGNEYGAGWANMIDSSFRALGGTSTGLTAFSPEATSVDADLRRAFGSNEQAVVLVARARTGAAVVEEWASLGLGKRWYFVPALHDQVFLDNIPPGVVDDMVGISPALGDDAAAFETLFSDRWDGDRPLAPGYFYFDAILLWALASEAARTGSADPTGAQVAQKLLEVSSPPGTAYTWQELPQALAAVRNGEDIDFIGTTGAVNFDSRGDVEASGNRFWHVDSDTFIEE